MKDMQSTNICSNNDPQEVQRLQQEHQVPQQQTGLDHLVEAATALTQLVHRGTTDISKTEQPQQQQQQHQISDDEESKSKQASTTAVASPKADTDTCMDTSTSQSSTMSSSSSSSPMPMSIPLKLPGESAKEIFPRRLHRILSDPTISDIITWLPHGGAFVILRTDELAETVLPRYFPESCASAQAASKVIKAKTGTGTGATTTTKSKSQTCKYPSFTRKLNRWGFRQITRGQDSGAFHHKCFNREEPDLCLKMVCQRSRRRKAGKGNGVTMDDIQMRPAAQVLGPYSAVLRQPLDSRQSQSQSQPQLLDIRMKHPTSSITDCESDSSFNNNTTTNTTVNANSGAAPALQPMQPKAVSMLYQKNDDQATIVSTSRSCNTPPPNSAQRSTNTPVTALLSPHLSLAAPNNTTHSPQVSEMVRSVSSLSSAPSNSMNINVSFPIFTNTTTPQIDPRVLLQHNMAATATAQAQAQAQAQATINQAIARAALPQIQQQQVQPTMPSYITLLDPKTVTQQQSQAQVQVQAPQTQAPVAVAAPVAQNVPVSYSTQILPVAAPVPTMQNSHSAQSTITTNSSNSTICSNNSNNSNVAIQQQQQQQQQTEAQLRVANAKNMLYSAFLQALG